MRSGAATVPRQRLLTLEQWGDLDEEVEGELVDGVLEEEEMPSVLHEIVVAWLLGVLQRWARRRGGLVLGSEAKLAVRKARGRKPDLSVYRRGALPRPADQVIRVTPEIVVEVTSPRPRDARRDRVEKPSDYAVCGARQYWIIDPELRTLEILQLDARGRYVHRIGASRGTLTRIPGCPGLRLPLDELWREIDATAAEGSPPVRARTRPRAPARR